MSAMRTNKDTSKTPHKAIVVNPNAVDDKTRENIPMRLKVLEAAAGWVSTIVANCEQYQHFYPNTTPYQLCVGVSMSANDDPNKQAARYYEHIPMLSLINAAIDKLDTGNNSDIDEQMADVPTSIKLVTNLYEKVVIPQLKNPRYDSPNSDLVSIYLVVTPAEYRQYQKAQVTFERLWGLFARHWAIN